jgi:hypothetical protein
MLPAFHRSSVVALATALAIGGCGATTTGLQGISCKVDADCNSGLSCLTVYSEGDAGEDAGCSSIGAECLQRCKTNSDCTEQGYLCFTGCGGAPACLPGYSATDAAADAVHDASQNAVTDAASDVTSQ